MFLKVKVKQSNKYEWMEISSMTLQTQRVRYHSSILERFLEVVIQPWQQLFYSFPCQKEPFLHLHLTRTISVALSDQLLKRNTSRLKFVAAMLLWRLGKDVDVVDIELGVEFGAIRYLFFRLFAVLKMMDIFV